ncbi:MAG: lysine--tRNA ligase [Pyrinomonadaceae bacterium]
MKITNFDEIVEQNDQTQARRDHLEELRALVGNVYPNKFARSRVSGGEDTITSILHFAPVTEVVAEIKAVVAKLAERERPPAEIKDALNARLRQLGIVRIAGRLTTPPRGNFVHLTNGMNKLQIYAKKGTFGLVRNDAENSLDEENGWTAFGLLDHGDFIGVEGYLFITNTGELSVHVEKLQFLAKAMVPMPDKMHGIEDPELKQRRRYVDLIGSSLQVEHEGMTTREVFETRAKVISSLRRFLEDHGYIEVETPMLTPKATGAAAKPFETHHNALDIKLYARIAPELYLKRLVVGGFEKVYELNRNFRNEGISYKHNPEFTMLEFYCAYMDVNGMMDFCEKMMQESVQKATGGLTVTYEGNEIDFSKFERISMKDAVKNLLQDTFPGNDDFADEKFVTAQRLSTVDALVNRALAEPVANFQGSSFHIDIDSATSEKTGVAKQRNIDKLRTVISTIMDSSQTSEEIDLSPPDEAGILEHLFELIVEETLTQPTFITDYPKSISPLSKASPSNPQIAERFELFINGMEVANGFSELNDPQEQYERFVDQMTAREGGDEEAMVLDEDYIRALSYGMPPAAGIGIGIDRLVMLLTNKHSIRDVILFPHMRPERKEAANKDLD